MKKIGTLSAALAIGLAVSLSACNQPGGNAKLDTDIQKASYTIGTNIGQNMKAQPVELDAVALTAGLTDALKGKELRLKPEQMQEAMTKIQQIAMEKQKEKTGVNVKAGADYLAQNKGKPNVKTTASGLQYEVIAEGTGPMPKATDVVKVHYTGTLIDGTKFDSSVDRGQPAEFPVGQVIKGWVEALQMMKVGAKWKLAIPYELAYGMEGRPPQIPGGSTLLFEVQLLEIVKAPAAAGKKK